MSATKPAFASVREGGSQAPTYAASSASGSSNSSVRGGSGASQIMPQRSVSPAGSGVAVTPSPVRRSTYGRPTTIASYGSGPTSSDSAAGCQAPRSRGSVLRSPSASAPTAGRSLTQAQSRPSSSLARGAAARCARGGMFDCSPSEGSSTHVPVSSNSQPW